MKHPVVARTDRPLGCRSPLVRCNSANRLQHWYCCHTHNPSNLGATAGAKRYFQIRICQQCPIYAAAALQVTMSVSALCCSRCRTVRLALARFLDDCKRLKCRVRTTVWPCAPHVLVFGALPCCQVLSAARATTYCS